MNLKRLLTGCIFAVLGARCLLYPEHLSKNWAVRHFDLLRMLMSEVSYLFYARILGGLALIIGLALVLARFLGESP